MHKLMQYWGGPALPVGLSERMEKCRATNPNLGYKLISSVGAATRLNRWFGSDIANGFLSIRMEAMRSDVFRVAWILRKGGYYVDAASEVLSSFDEWVVKDKINLLKKPNMINNKLFCNGFIYAPYPGHPFLQEVWSRQEHILLSRKSNTANIWSETGPGLFLDVLKNMSQQIAPQIILLSPDKYDQKFRFDSSTSFLKDSSQHWSKRQDLGESLFID